jgi:hypothetical protein
MREEIESFEYKPRLDKAKHIIPRKRRINAMKNLTPLRAIRQKCLECSAGQPSEVKHCPCTECPLYPYRMGTNPKRAGKAGNLANLNQSEPVQ